MNFLRMCVIILAVNIVKAEEELMEERTFCGDNLIETLQKFCKKYYTPDYRTKRQVVDECCRSMCSTYHLMSNYCESYDKDEVIQYLREQKKGTQNRDRPETEKRKRRRRRRQVNRRID